MTLTSRLRSNSAFLTDTYPRRCALSAARQNADGMWRMAPAGTDRTLALKTCQVLI